MKIKLLLLTIISIALFNALGQEMKVSGTVYDTTGNKPLPNAIAMAIRVKDSLLLSFDRTDANGNFNLKGLQMDTFSLVIAHPSADDKTYFIFGNPENLEINIPNVTMPAKSQLIDEVIIYAYKDPIYYKGDTLVYVADSFKVGENAVVEDLLKKLPGITVDKDGKIKSQGQDITKVLVDGDEFFGADPTIATRNLGAKGVESVQVYEKENTDGTFGSDEKIKVLDLKLKDDAKKGYFGRISGASDFTVTNGKDAFYEGELLLNKFSGSQKISVFALGSNTPKANFGWGDLNKFGLDNEDGGGNRWGGGQTTSNGGIPRTLKAGIYYSDKFGKNRNGKISFNYSYYNTELDANTASRSQYFLADTTYFTDDSTRNYTKNEAHRITLNFETNFDSLTKIYVRPELKLDYAKTDKTDMTSFFGEDNFQSLTTNINNKSKSDGLGFSTSVGIERKFMKPKRMLTADYYINLVDNNTEGNLLSTTNYIFAGFDSTTSQSKLNNNNEIEHSIYADYTEPFGKFIKVTLGYNLMMGNLNQDRSTYDFNTATNDFSTFNSDLSNIFESNRIEHRGGVKFAFDKPKHSIHARLDARNIQIQNDNLITLTTVNQNVSNFLPIVEYEYKPSMSKRFSVRYSTNSDLPSISDLQPVRDNTNPNRLKIGNADLKPNYNHNLNINFNTWQALSGRYIWSGLWGSVIDNAFANSIIYDNFGRTISQTTNVDGNVNANLYAGAGFPFFKQKFTFQPSGNASFNHYTNFVNNQRNVTDNFGLNLQLELRMELDSLEIAIGNRFSYNNPKSSLSSVSNTPYSQQNYNARFMWRLPLGFKIESDIEYNILGRRADGFNINYLIWNAQLSKSFLKTENLVLAAIANDILDQNVNAQRQVNANVVVDNRTRIISRYFLLKLTYRFNNNKTKETDGGGWF